MKNLTKMENNFSAENSLRLITETIERSRRTMAKNSGKPMILWGVLVAVTSVVIYFLWSKTGNPIWNLLWFAMSAIGGLGTYSIGRKREKTPATEISRILGKIWMWFGFFTTGFYLLLWVVALIRYSAHMEGIVSVDLTLLITMMMGLCGAISGAVMNCKPVTVCSALATALSVVFVLLVPNGAPVQILTFLILGVFALIIPGVILQNKAKA
ncbi:MAG: hypothetical protein IKI66_04005 [Bacteroidales bacterium]|nr:hypothetical protein [Bacteroidales bacterium]